MARRRQCALHTWPTPPRPSHIPSLTIRNECRLHEPSCSATVRHRPRFSASPATSPTHRTCRQWSMAYSHRSAIDPAIVPTESCWSLHIHVRRVTRPHVLSHRSDSCPASQAVKLSKTNRRQIFSSKGRSRFKRHLSCKRHSVNTSM